jgi:hypothetical protein
VAVEYFQQQGQPEAVGGVTAAADSSTNSSSRPGYAFKCHRRADLAYPVNTIAFHPGYGTRLGSGVVCVCVCVYVGIYAHVCSMWVCV